MGAAMSENEVLDGMFGTVIQVSSGGRVSFVKFI
ncbi:MULTISPECIES: hypothetical protein [Photorhabdus]